MTVLLEHLDLSAVFSILSSITVMISKYHSKFPIRPVRKQEKEANKVEFSFIYLFIYLFGFTACVQEITD